MHRLIPLAALACILTGCAQEVAGPGLARRPIEALPLTEPPSAPTPPVAADTALRGQIDGLVAQARQAQKSFSALLPRARQTAAGVGAEGSESWIAAQQALSALEAARAPATRALGELDALLAAKVNAGSDDGVAELQAAETEVGALVEDQARAIDALRNGIRD